MIRALTSINPNHVPCISPDVAIVGTGIAGLAAALVAAETSNVLLLSKAKLNETATSKAQGGIAAALEEESTDSHFADTVRAGAGLCDPDRVKILVEEGVERVRELIALGIPFDRSGSQLSFTMEGGHSARRILHGNGDATGKVIQDSLLPLVREHPRIQILEEHFAIDLLHSEDICSGLLCLDVRYSRPLRINAKSVIVATGGIGQTFRETTNPAIATADGVALCFRAGAELCDMEFIQFHPTTLYLAGAPRFLISEAVRGEGAHLLTPDGYRFMPEAHPDAELAPRDVVSQATIRTMEETQSNNVVLDLSQIPADKIQKRFPTIGSLCAEYGIDITRDPIPVRPAVHYMMGGVATDINGQTKVKNLYACGEVARTGVHGANRLASNSLLEGLVFGHRAGLHAATHGISISPHKIYGAQPRRRREHLVPLDTDDLLRSLKALTWRCLGIFRNPSGLLEAEQSISFWEEYVSREDFTTPAGFELQNMLTAARVIAKSATMRTESRGAHQRVDFPLVDDEHWCNSIYLTRNDF